MTQTNRAVADKVDDLMRTAGVTKLAMAEQTTIPRSTLMRRLSGATSFTVAELAAIADVLDVTIHDLIPTSTASDKQVA